MPHFNKFGTLSNDQHVTWEELLKVWGSNPHRRKLLEKARAGFQLLKASGVETVYIAGSFASTKSTPGDIDGCISTSGNFDADKLPDDILEVLEDHGMDFYFDVTPTDFDDSPHIDFFRKGRNGENPGLIILDLRTVPEN